MKNIKKKNEKIPQNIENIKNILKIIKNFSGV